MSRGSKNYKRGYRDSTVDHLVGFVGPFLLLPIFTVVIAGILWTTDKFNPQFASNLASGNSTLSWWLFGGVAVFAIWKGWNQKISRKNRERAAEDFYGSRQPSERE